MLRCSTDMVTFVEKNFLYQTPSLFSCRLQRAGEEPGDGATVDQMKCYHVYTHNMVISYLLSLYCHWQIV